MADADPKPGPVDWFASRLIAALEDEAADLRHHAADLLGAGATMLSTQRVGAALAVEAVVRALKAVAS